MLDPSSSPVLCIFCEETCNIAIEVGLTEISFSGLLHLSFDFFAEEKHCCRIVIRLKRITVEKVLLYRKPQQDYSSPP